MKRAGHWIILLGLIALGVAVRFRTRIEAWVFERYLARGVPSIQVGPPTAKVQVVAHVPFGQSCRPDILELYRLAKQQYPGRVAVRYLDFSSLEGRRLAEEEGFLCAGISINGEIVFTGPVLEGHQKSAATGGPGPAGAMGPEGATGGFAGEPFTLAELRAAIAQAVAEAYPSDRAPATSQEKGRKP